MPTKTKAPRKNKVYVAAFIPQELHAAMKAAAIKEGRSLSNYAVRILSKVLNTAQV